MRRFATDSQPIRCRKCAETIPPDDFNVAADTAFCRACGTPQRFSEAVRFEEADWGDPNVRPRGTEFIWTESGFKATATTRSAYAFFLVPFATVWVGGSLGALYGLQFAEGEFDLLRSIFGIPFVVASCWIGSWAVMLTCGRVEARRDGDRGEIFTGAVRIGWTRRFFWSALGGVGEQETTTNRGATTKVIALELGTDGPFRTYIKFGSFLSEERRRWLQAVIAAESRRGHRG